MYAAIWSLGVAEPATTYVIARKQVTGQPMRPTRLSNSVC